MMRFKVNILVTVFILIGLIGSSVYAQTTPYNMNITNISIISAANAVANASATHITNVERVLGARFGPLPSDQPGSAGQTYDFVYEFTNLGNAAENFVFAIATNTNSGTVGGAWGTVFLPTALDVPAGNVAEFTLRVTVHASADNDSMRGYHVSVSNTNWSTAVKNMVYEGDNGTWYGGNMGANLTDSATNEPGMLYHGEEDRWITLTISGPVLWISKEITDVILGGASGQDVIPGATINYRIVASNIGSTVATNVQISDDIPNNTVFTGFLSAVSFGSQYTNGGTVYWTNTTLNTGTGANNEVVIEYAVTIN